MIHIRYSLHENHMTHLEVTGHSGSAEKGKDLICAAVSGIMFGLLNALDELTDVKKLSVKDNLIQIDVDKPSDKSDLLLSAGLIQLKTVWQSNKDFIEIKKLEV
ncbi:MAG: ribosomal-processing cysteine protease Prp [Erysipelotrichaceae bacterium]|nr:ribosomal-processing cysteine protease Prp [Erysipelotrichaceae bacterium]MDY6034889.1 ribosomal-processing cysteine protease Prp [Bulleidia sp.]